MNFFSYCGNNICEPLACESNHIDYNNVFHIFLHIFYVIWYCDNIIMSFNSLASKCDKYSIINSFFLIWQNVCCLFSCHTVTHDCNSVIFNNMLRTHIKPY